MIRTILMAAAIAAVAALAAAPAHAEKDSPKPSVKFEKALKDLEDNQSLQQFEIQSTARNAENVRSQAEKRLEQQRRDLTRNWGG